MIVSRFQRLLLEQAFLPCSRTERESIEPSRSTHSAATYSYVRSSDAQPRHDLDRRRCRHIQSDGATSSASTLLSPTSAAFTPGPSSSLFGAPLVTKNTFILARYGQAKQTTGTTKNHGRYFDMWHRRSRCCRGPDILLPFG